MIHELKIYPEFFEAVISGKKTFEVRTKDRPFDEGDLLALNEWDLEAYTGRSCLVYVDYILNDTRYVNANTVIMSIKPCSVYRHTEPFRPEKLAKDYSVPLATNNNE